MDADRWKRINEIFHDALDRDPADRAGFVEAACGGDAALRGEIESLLASHAEVDGFIERPAFEAGAELLRTPSGEELAARAQSLVGKQIGPYLVEASLGYGGMGVVWLARDSRLDRRVALKALADHLGRDERSRERLRREAKAAAALSHPGIATVFALEEFDDHLYIAYEYVEGQTLREELLDGTPPRQALVSTALSIARGLAAAHESGIVHRDLKPENVVRGRDGDIKILDFGLASFRPSPMATVDSGGEGGRLTLPGMLVGTPSYMSPEQLRGRDVDHRSDLFSFGVMLYEMATGIHPFEGDDPASTIARILEVEPRRLPDDFSSEFPELEPLLRSLLAKDPAGRYARTEDLVADLERLQGGVPTRGSAEPPQETARAEPGDQRRDAFWWWRFHQLALSVVYGLGCVGAWLARQWNPDADLALPATVLFYVVVAMAIAAGSMRLHLAFAARYYPAELQRQRRRTRSRIQLAEFVYAAAVAGLASLLGRSDSSVALLLSTVLFAVAVGILVFARMIEPATTVAAFPPE